MGWLLLTGSVLASSVCGDDLKLPATVPGLREPTALPSRTTAANAKNTKKAPARVTGAKDAKGGLVRVVNLSGEPRSFNLLLSYHKDPWSLRQVLPQHGKVEPGEASPWICVPQLVDRNPITVTISAPGTPDGTLPVAQVEFASAPSTNALLRALPLGKDPVVVECSHADFQTADELKTDAEIGQATLAAVKAMTFKGKAPARFPTGYPAGHASCFEAGRLLGFNAVHMPAGKGRDLVDRYGYRYVYTYTHWLSTPGAGSGYQRDKNAEHAGTLAAQWQQAGLLDRLYYVSVRDEAELDVGTNIKKAFFARASSDPPAWSQILRAGGVRPDELIRPDNRPPPGLDPMSSNYWAYVVGFTADDRKANPQGVYDSMKAIQGLWPARFGNISAALHDALGSNVLTVANIHISAFVRDNLSGIDPWLNYSRMRTLDVPQACDYWIGWPQQEEFLIDLLRCAGRPHDMPVDAMLQAQSSYMPQTPRSLKLRAMSAVGAGARSFSFYEWGPRYRATENWYDTDTNRLRVIGEVNHAVGWVDDIVMDGRPPQARIAILYSRPSELWDRLAPSDGIEKPGTYLAERRVLYHLLRGLQQPVDMIDDEVLPAEQGIDVDTYACIFMSQRCITAKGADMLLDWVRRGGTLIGIVSCGQFNELGQPWDRMTGAFGLTSLAARELRPDETNRLEGVGMALRRLVSRVDVKDAAVTMRFADGSPAVTEKALGKGRLIYAAWAPGAAYHTGITFTNGVPVGMQEAVREVVAGWIRPAGPSACATDHPLVSARLIRSPRDSAVVLINSSGEDRLSRVRVTLRGMSVKRVESLEQGPLRFTGDGDVIVIELPLGLIDVVRISS